MRKRSVLVFLIILASCSFFTTNSVGLSAGDLLQYEIVKCRIHVEYNGTTQEGIGFKFEDTSIPEGTVANITMIYINEGFHRYNLTIGEKSHESYQLGSWFGHWHDDSYMFRTQYYAYSLERWYSEYNYTNGFWFHFVPYFYPDQSTWDLIQLIIDEYSESYDSWIDYGYAIDYSFTYTDKRNVIYFEHWNGGRIDGDKGYVNAGIPDIEVHYKFGNQFQMTIDKTTGVIKGVRVRGFVSGTINSYPIKLSIETHYELLDYNLPRFKDGRFSNYVPGFTILLGIIALIPVIYLKKKNSIKY